MQSLQVGASLCEAEAPDRLLGVAHRLVELGRRRVTYRAHRHDGNDEVVQADQRPGSRPRLQAGNMRGPHEGGTPCREE